MKRLLLALALVAVACADNPPEVDITPEVQWEKIGAFTYVAKIDVEGTTCIVMAADDHGGIDCDWPAR